MAAEIDGVGQGTAASTDHQPTRVDACLKQAIKAMLALGHGERVGLSGCAENGYTVTASTQQASNVVGEPGCIDAAVRLLRSKGGAPDTGCRQVIQL